ncbi:ornithine cyclodeaminase family protein [Dickeya dadantii]|uniref:ornithine cyclodeaminase family protein n=1 Tax=Dickeya dadantii TaxID=204038 RepID=UPI0013736CC2|nr:ornithine cyclodeaminase family protein [Dickeya dadantii]NAT76989.1 ornithine cyclodeaminase family protein [Dickeya dadantii]NPE63714.1 ornithine cyclodeaminase family protein [Dickeya dadantii]
MFLINEKDSATLASHAMAYEAVRAALIDAVHPATANFPVVHGHGSDPGNRFTVKSGATPELAGLKVGSYWPGNLADGLPCHNSIIFLFDQSRGVIDSAVEAGTLNAYRTAAADAVATDVLARADASVLAVFGTGHQARYEAEAVARIRPIKEILVVGRSDAATQNMVDALRANALPARACQAEAACRAADIIITATTARAPLFDAAWVRPGTHVSSMGSDAAGKQELPVELLAAGKLFCDLPAQSRRIGEFQHAGDDKAVFAIGDVLSGNITGREAASDITVFDSSGLAIQDLYVAKAVIEAWRHQHA